jgi:hypothetical protein
VSWWKVGGCNSRSSLVGIESGSCRSLSVFSSLKLGEISVIISLHLVIKDLGFLRSRVGNERVINNAENVGADADKFCLNLGLVVLSFRRNETV